MKKGEIRLDIPVHIAVEGINPMHFLRVKIQDDPQCQKIQLHDFMEEAQKMNLDRWLRSFHSLVDVNSSIKSIGIICDAEYSRESMLQSVQDKIQKYFDVTPQSGEIVSAGNVKIGLLVVPSDPESNGCFEHAMLLASKNSKERYCAEAFIECLEQQDQTSESSIIKNENTKAKITVRAMIAAHKPDMLFSNSVNTKLWDWEQPSLASILDFLRRMDQEA